MKKVRFIGENLVDEDGKVVISPEDLISKCMENVAYSYKVIEIVRYTVKGLGYELSGSSKYRRSALFNKVEDTILKSGLYTGRQKPKINRPQKNPADQYITRVVCDQYNRVAREGKRNFKRSTHWE